MIAMRVSSIVMLNSLRLTTQESALLHLQALVTALLSSSLELAPHQAEPGHGRNVARQRVHSSGTPDPVPL